MKKYNEFINESFEETIYLKTELEPGNNPIFWERAGYYNVNLGNLIDALKQSYGYEIDNFDTREDNFEGVKQGFIFLEQQYPLLSELEKTQDTEYQLKLRATEIPNQYKII